MSGHADELSTSRQELLRKLIRVGAGNPAEPGVRRRPVTGPVPLAFGQERVWLLSQLAADVPVFNLTVVLPWEGSFDEIVPPAGVRPADRPAERLVAPPFEEDLLRERVERLAARHDSLRSSVVLDAGEPRLQVHPRVPVEVEIHDLHGAGPEALDTLAAQIGCRPYRLDRPPLWRIAALRAASGRVHLVVATHHLVADAMSLAMMAAELVYGWQGDTPVTFADFTRWQREQVATGRLERHERYWRRQLAELPPPVCLPSDHQITTENRFAGGSVQRVVPADVSQGIRDVARALRATPYSVMLAAYLAFLHHYTARDDFLVGISMLGRTRKEIEYVVGMFSNLLPVRLRVDPNLPFEALVAEVRDRLAEMMNWQEFPYSLIHPLLRPADGTGGEALPVAFNMPVPFQQTERTSAELPVAMAGSQFDLTAHVLPRRDGTYRLILEYSARRFTEEHAGLLAEQLLVTLRQALTAASPIRELSLVADPGGAVLRGPNPPDRDAPLLPALIDSQLRRTPEAVALATASGTLTYRQLGARVAQRAGLLRRCGAGRETLVAVCLGRDVELVVTLLAVWRVGAAYLPMDPAQPVARLRQLLDTAGADLVVTTVPAAELHRPDGTVIHPEADFEADSDAEPGTSPESVVVPAAQPLSPAQAAYLVFTSGSTGKPKGVVVTHGGIANRVAWTIRQHRLGATDRVLQKTPLTFDAAAWEIFAPLASGGCVVLPPEGIERDPEALVAAVAAQQVSVLQVVPTLLRRLVAEDGWRDCTQLRLVMCAGEPLPEELCARLQEKITVELYNTYGPTECAIDVTAHRYSPVAGRGTVPIGLPIDRTHAVVLGPHGLPVPVGHTGELLVGGPNVGRGYAGRPSLTAERFLPDPYGPPGSRLYRTGDVVRRRFDGALEFVGRLDDQVKVNGVRIEPAEVEAALHEHPEVRDAAVAVVPAEGQQRLVGYLVADRPLPPAELRAFLRDRLPAGLIPAAFLQLDSLPKTTSGKLDRRALPAPEHIREPVAPPAPPRPGAEAEVAAVWRELLGLDEVSRDDDFFQLGGHSMQLPRLAARLADRLGVPVGVRDLFTAGTVAAQASLLTAADRRLYPPIRPVPRGAPLPASAEQRRMWWLDQQAPDRAENVVPVVLEIDESVDEPAVTAALTALQRRHEVLRSGYDLVGSDLMQVPGPPAAVEVRQLDLSAATEPELHEAVGRELTNPFDLATGPVLRAAVLRLANPPAPEPDSVPPQRRLLLLVVHHIAGDQRSTEIMRRDLRQLLQGGEAPPPPPLQYADYAHWQRDRLASGDFDSQRGYWRAALAGARPFELVTDWPRPAEWSGRGAVCAVQLPAGPTDRLLQLGRDRGASPFMTMLAVVAVLLARYTGEEEVAVAVPVSGRTRAGLDEIVGCFANTLVVRIRLAGSPSFATLLDRVRSTVSEALACQDVPFDTVVEDARLRADPSRRPLTQVMFDYLEGDDPLPATAAARFWRTAKFDLTLGMARGQDGQFAGYVEYATDLFAPETVDRLVGHLRCLVESIAGAPAHEVTRLPMLTAAERERAVPVPGGPAAPVAGTVVSAFRAVAAATPEREAVRQGDASLSYRQLQVAAERLAGVLHGLGVGPEQPVAVLLPRCPAAVVAVLGTLLAGGYVVPLDPESPGPRVRELLRERGGPPVITLASLAGLAGAGGGPVLLLNAEAGDLDGPVAQPEPPQPSAPPERGDLAYVIHTSGSTGRPKAVAVTHGSWADHTAVVTDAYGLRSDDRLLLLGALFFDVAFEQLAMALTTGATVLLAAAEPWSPEELAEQVRRRGVTAIDLTPAHLRGLLEVLDPADERLAGLRLLNVGSDAVPTSDIARWHQLGLPARVVCSYGTTETTITAALHWPERTGAAPAALVPIGRTLPATRGYVLDPWLNPVPVGVPGELYLGGGRLARGYLGQPGQTAERFLPDPFADTPGARMYRTGDLVRWLPDGELAMLGRTDQQLKIRGYRIEPAEIEAALRHHRDVAVAAVVGSGPPEARALVAYVVPVAGAEPAPVELAGFVRGRLPEYCVPARWVLLPKLPLGPTGKVDMRALPEPDDADRARHTVRSAPEGVAEQRLAAIWTELLGVPEVGRHDDFFDLGGHSLLVAGLRSAIESAFDVRLPLLHLFTQRTVAEQAAAVEAEIEAEVAALSDHEIQSLMLSEE